MKRLLSVVTAIVLPGLIVLVTAASAEAQVFGYFAGPAVMAPPVVVTPPVVVAPPMIAPRVFVRPPVAYYGVPVVRSAPGFYFGAGGFATGPRYYSVRERVRGPYYRGAYRVRGW